MRRITIVLYSIILLMSSSGCQKSDNEVLRTSISQIDTSCHTEQLHDYDSPYTICYKNKDSTYSMYIFASPIQYKTNDGYAIIDNTVIKSKKEGFAFENKANNVKTYFPKTLSNPFRVELENKFLEFNLNWDNTGFSEARQTIFTNMYGDKVSAVIYERKDMDLAFYPTKAGIKMEIILKEKQDSNGKSFKVKSGVASYENKQNGYVLFRNGGEIESLIYQPLVQYTVDKGQELDVTTQINIERKGGDFYVETIIDESIINNAKYPIKLDLSFEMYLNKMPDSTVYSNRDVNNYLASYAVVGKHPVLGEGWHYLRVRLNWFMTLDGSNITKAFYNVYSLSSCKNNTRFSLLDIDEQWSSVNVLWDTRSQNYNAYLDDILGEDNYVQFDMTEFFIKSFEDVSWQEESNGLLLRAKSIDSFDILATSDNCLYPPYIRFDIVALPSLFVAQENINPSSN